MKKLFIIATLILFAFPCLVYADQWTSKDTAYQAAFLLFHSADYLQTKEIIRNPKFYERNLILGRDPTHNQVDAYFLGTALAHTAIAYLLPKRYRRIWQCVFIGLEMRCVACNLNAGVRVRF